MFDIVFHTIFISMTIEQIIDIPADRRIFFEFLVPKEIPTGPARIELQVTLVIGRQVRSDSKGGSTTPRADRLLGIASHLGDISLEEIREERLAKYLL